MTERGVHTLQEILSQPETWEKTLSDLSSVTDLPDARQYDQVLFTGCGSTYYLSLAAAALYTELTGRLARALPASEVWLNPAQAYPQGLRTLLVAVSRSGETSETLHACEAFRKHHSGQLITLVNVPESPLATMGDVNILLPAGQETSFCQTRAFTSLYLASTWLCLQWGDLKHSMNELHQLPETCQKLLDQFAPLAEQTASNMGLDRFYFLGSGSRYGLACELSLKMKEMSLSHSEPFHFMEFRHGPKSMVSESSLIIGLRSESQRTYEQAVLNDMKALGGQILCMDNTDADVRFNTSVAEPLRNILYLPVGQLFAYWRSMVKGLDPDRPHNLDAVIRLS
ncbi:predicted phosphosugar isomerases [Anaerolinea thermolimosa]|uniref:SIS domain-containing protein n=1 Tax=Anaerolinea thermolimosa TaxID=229919 RepID=UPI00078320E8|nr:SIS domain-containing protein [Anaerolinea thermolimosa]GAP05940.1 predicted phosphosugar isomerases [Anaerolinea thermolimosa]